MMQGAMELCSLSYNPVSNAIWLYEAAPDGEGERLLAIMKPGDEHYAIAFKALHLLGTKSEFARQCREINETNARLQS